MNKTGWFLASFAACLLGFVFLGMQVSESPAPTPPPQPSPIQPLPTPPQPPTPPIPVDPDLAGVQVPIAKENRIYNTSGSQCVWVSIETLSRHHGVKDIYEGENRISKHYTWATGPGEVYRVLNSRYPNVKWKQVQNRSLMKPFIKKYVTEEKLGVGLAIPGHMLTLIHYDEKAGVVKVIDNAGPRALQVQEWSMDKFNRTADGWVLVIFPPGYTETRTDSFDFPLSDPNKLYGLTIPAF